VRASAVRTALTASTGLAIGALVLSGCSTGGGAGSAPPPASTTTCPAPDAGANAQDTASYRMVASTSQPETMVTQEQADAQGLTEGELLVGETAMGSMADANANRHVEVAICDLATGTTVTGADVTMQILSGARSHDMMVMEMRGLDEPVTESHYGNNTVVPSTAYRVRVTVNGESAEFPMTAAH
jgi:hypothetical protein